MTPSEEILEASRRGLQILIDGLKRLDIYDRTTFSDLRVFYNNLFQTAIRARQMEETLSRLGVVFDEVDDEPETIDEAIQRFQDDLDRVSGVSEFSTGQIPGFENAGAINGTPLVPNESVGRTPRIVLKFPTFSGTNRVPSPTEGNLSGDSLLPD